MPRQKLKFEGLAARKAPAFVPDGTGELNWLNVLAVDKAINTIPGGNLEIVPHSGRAVATTQLGAILTPNDDFDVRRAFFSAAQADSTVEVHVKAYDDGVLVGSRTFTVGTGENLLVRFGKKFKSIDQVEIDTLRPDGSGIFAPPVAMDDLVVVTQADAVLI